MRKSLLFLAIIGACIYGFIDYSTKPVDDSFAVTIEVSRLLMVAQKNLELFLPKLDTALNYTIIATTYQKIEENKLDVNKQLLENLDFKND